MDDNSESDAEAKNVRDASLSARFSVLERELEVAPYHKIRTSWWDDRVIEMQAIKRKLNR